MGPFLTHLDAFAASGEEFSLELLISNLTLDIIGAAVMDVDLDAQHIDHAKQGELVRLFSQILVTFSDDKNNLPWYIVPLTAYRRFRLGRRIDTLVKDVIRRKYVESRGGMENKSHSILALSLQDTEILTNEILSQTSDQVKTFLFAGHDTNSAALQWAFYELSRTPRALKALRHELDSVLGLNSDPAVVSSKFAENNENLFSQMHYLNAIIKETLRLYPPGATVRRSDPGAGCIVRSSTGEEYCIDGMITYSCLSIIHRDPAVYGDNAEDWVPERWLGEAGKSIPATAWRPFERGPRNCIGQELANLESRIILAMVARKYDFVKVGLGEAKLDENGLPEINEKGQHKTNSPLYSVSCTPESPSLDLRLKG
jgi:cytochrome P450